MFKYLILFVFSFQIAALDGQESQDNSSDFEILDNFQELLTTSALNKGEIVDLESSAKINKTKAKKRKREHSYSDHSENAKKTKQEDLKCEDLKYIESTKELEALIQNALLSLDHLTSTKSYSQSFGMTHKPSRRKTFDKLYQGELAPFVPLFEKFIEIIEEEEKKNGLIVQHIAINVDPNMNIIGRNSDRSTTSRWHDHRMDAGRYLFALTTKNEFSTLIRHGSAKIHIGKNRLFFMPGPMEHRTPTPPDEENNGKRIHLAIGLISTAFCPLE